MTGWGGNGEEIEKLSRWESLHRWKIVCLQNLQLDLGRGLHYCKGEFSGSDCMQLLWMLGKDMLGGAKVKDHVLQRNCRQLYCCHHRFNRGNAC